MNDTKNVSLSGIWINDHLLEPDLFALVVNAPHQDFPEVVAASKDQDELIKQAALYDFPIYSSCAIYNYDREKIWDAQHPSTLGKKTIRFGSSFGLLDCIENCLF